MSAVAIRLCHQASTNPPGRDQERAFSLGLTVTKTPLSGAVCKAGASEVPRASVAKFLKRSGEKGHLVVFSPRIRAQKTLSYPGVRPWRTLPGGCSLEGAPWRTLPGGRSLEGRAEPSGRLRSRNSRLVAHPQEGRAVSLTERLGPGAEMRPHRRAQTLP